jgi:hypothetical protein
MITILGIQTMKKWLALEKKLAKNIAFGQFPGWERGNPV